MQLDEKYWQTRYSERDTPWDIGHAAPPLKDYIAGLEDLDMRILIPGAGKAYEAIHLHQLGFRQVFVLDWAEKAFDHLRAMAPDFPEVHLLCDDFFRLDGQFDLVLEQTFFCALKPHQREQYAAKMASLLPSGGTLAGLLFASEFERPGPPYGGTESEYRALFEVDFQVKRMELAKNSILPRMNNELFFELIKK